MFNVKKRNFNLKKITGESEFAKVINNFDDFMKKITLTNLAPDQYIGNIRIECSISVNRGYELTLSEFHSDRSESWIKIGYWSEKDQYMFCWGSNFKGQKIHYEADYTLVMSIIKKWEMSNDISANLTKSTIVDFIDNYLEDNVIGQDHYGAYFKKIKAPKNSKADNLLFVSWEEPYTYENDGCGFDGESWTAGAICNNTGCKGCGWHCTKKRIGALERTLLKIFFDNDGFIHNVVEEKKYITE